ncbi:LysR family transcriptional regulator [Neorhizobium sp. LjRoot104]|uniref:LysR family transcriptional regulator n=1 Tax=Neorhizobium sp. LjRoot104 TaxID=3342254 RepID=UPI003ECDC434
MLDWENLRYFLALSNSGTLLGAARALSVEHATVSRRVALLEQQLQARLVDRRGRKITLTVEGERVAELARRMEEQALATDQARLKQDRLAGTVRISAPPALSDFLLPEPIAMLRRRHPEIEIVVAGEKRYASLNRREADIAVRLARPEQGDLTVMRIGSVRFDFYASPSYLAETPQEEWSFISYGEDMDTSPQHRRLLDIAGGRRVGLRASTLEFQRAMARAGGGVAILPDFFISAGDGLALALVEEEPVTRDIWLVVHSDIRDVPIVRAVMDAIKEGARRRAGG